jgi:acetyl esterase/lipase
MVQRHIGRGGRGRIAALAPFLAAFLILNLGACSGKGGGTEPGSDQGILTSGPHTYDGSFFDPLGPFHITDLRSKMVATDTDSVDLYAEMVDYETRNLTVYYPPGASQRPVVFFIHGGAWVDGYMEWYDFVANSFTAEAGYVTVVINYRLTSDEVFPTEICPTKEGPAPDPSLKAAYYPDNIRDCADALQWTVDHVAEYGGDPEQIFVFGHSAGGHLASLLVTHPDFAPLRPHVRGVITMSGAYTLSELNTLVFGEALELTFRTDTDASVLAEASPTTYVTPDLELPPFLVLYAEGELPSLTSQALAFVTRLTETGHEVESQYLAGYDHTSEMTAIAFSYEAPTARILRFIAEHGAETP